MVLSDQSIIVARERYADLLREADRERRLNGLRTPGGSRPAVARREGSLWTHSVRRMRAIALNGRSPLAPCLE